MSEAWPDGAVEFVQAIADTKLLLSHRYAEWMLAAPALEDDIAGASAAQDEMGHVRQLFRLLTDQGREQAWLEGDRAPSAFANASVLDEPINDWSTFVVRMNLAERAAWYLLDAIDHEDFDGLVDRIGQDEYFHLDYLDARLETLATESPEAVTEKAVTAMQGVLAFLGPASFDDGDDPLVGVGFTTVSVAQMRTAYRDHYEDAFTGTAVSLDAVEWSIPERDAWDPVRRRVDEGAVDRESIRQLAGVDSREFVVE